jgi:hypothetical protein
VNIRTWIPGWTGPNAHRHLEPRPAHQPVADPRPRRLEPPAPAPRASLPALPPLEPARPLPTYDRVAGRDFIKVDGDTVRELDIVAPLGTHVRGWCLVGAGHVIGDGDHVLICDQRGGVWATPWKAWEHARRGDRVEFIPVVPAVTSSGADA